MKKIIPIGLLILLGTGCKVMMPELPTFPPKLETFVIDYSRFDGFFLTESNSVSFEYKPIASVNTVYLNGIGATETVVVKEKEVSDNVYGTVVSESKKEKLVKTYGVLPATLTGTLDELVDKSKELGANGIINLKIKYNYNLNEVNGYEASGMAIKR